MIREQFSNGKYFSLYGILIAHECCLAEEDSRHEPETLSAKFPVLGEDKV
jgi:hypothetical protein